MLNPSLPMVAGLTLVLGCSLISGCVNAAPEHTPAADPPGTETAHWDVTVSNRRVTGLRYDPGGQARFGRQLLSEPLELLADGEPLDLEQDRVRVEDNGRTLVIAAGNDRPLTVKWPLQLSHAGYFDRLTGASLQNEGHDDPALLRFVSGGKGHTCVVEAAKRLDHGLWGLSNPGTTVIVKTRDSVQFVLDHGPGGSTSFPFENDRLTPTFQCPRGSLILRAYAEPEAIILEDGSPLPEFVFGNNTEVRTGTGGRVALNRLVNEFYKQAAFWYPSGHGISAWAAWGPLGHAYVDSPYRTDSRRALVGQVVGDDGNGHDGYAWSWGDRPGWPFPGGYDTRHFVMNALHICGMHTYMTWSGEQDLLDGIDLALRVHSGADAVLEQSQTTKHILLQPGQTCTQRFRSESAFDAFSLHARIPGEPQTGDPDHLRDTAAFPAAPDQAHQPLRVSQVAGQAVFQRLVIPVQANRIGILCCTWGRNDQRARFRAFRPQGDLEATLATPPLGLTDKAAVPDNKHVFIALDRVCEPGTEILLVVDRPEGGAADGEPTAGLWTLPLPPDSDRERALSPSPDTQDLRSMEVLFGMYDPPQLGIHLLDRNGNRVWDQPIRTFPAADGWIRSELERELPAGEYALTLTVTNQSVHCRASSVRTELGGTARRDGHSWNWLERARREMAYQLDVLQAREQGLLTLDGSAGIQDHSGVSGVSVGNHYYDILPFGGLDAYANAWFYASLVAMADLETLFGYPDNAAFYREQAERTRARYNEVFWTDNGYRDGARRYIGAVDTTGARHDYGFSFVNTLATAAGIPDPERGRAVLDWLDTGVTLAPDGVPRHDIYSYGFGPR
jgi:hypothetical protein